MAPGLLGGVAENACMQAFNEIRFALRTLWREPRFSFVAIVTLALGIGASASVFAVLHTVLLQPLPYADADRLVIAVENWQSEGPPGELISYPDWLNWREAAGELEGAAAFRRLSLTLTASGGARRLDAVQVSSGFLSLLGVTPLMGRDFTPGDERYGSPPVCLISHRLWVDEFGRRPGALGRTLPLHQAECEVAGVLPAGFRQPSTLQPADVLLPLVVGGPDAMTEQGSRWLGFLGRLRRGASLEQARQRIESLSREAYRVYEDPAFAAGFTLVPLRERLFGDVEPALWLLLGAVLTVLLIGCLNVSNLLLARHLSRQRELAVRTALGATRTRIARHLLLESAALAVAAGLLGLLLAAWAVDSIHLLIPRQLPRLEGLGIDWVVAGFAVACALVCALLAGSLPAVRASSPALLEALHGSRTDLPSARSRWRAALVLAEITLTLMLLVGCGLAAASLWRLVQVDTGFQTGGVLAVDVNLLDAATPEQRTLFYQDATRELAAWPGVDAVGVVDHLPLTPGYSQETRELKNLIEGAGQRGSEKIQFQRKVVGGGFFEGLRIPLLQGRLFRVQDEDPHSPPVAIVSRSLAERLWGDEDPLGRRLRIGRQPGEAVSVVGVVGDIRTHGPERSAAPTVYHPAGQKNLWFGTLALYSRRGDFPPLGWIRQRLPRADSEILIGEAVPMGEIYWSLLSRPRFYAVLLAVFAGLASVLAGIGVYGLIAYLVRQRTREIGIRLALGAAPRQISRQLLSRILLLAAVGSGLGLAASFALARFAQSLLFEISPTNPYVLAAAGAAMLLLAVLAAWLPSRRAMRIDPVEALRWE